MGSILEFNDTLELSTAQGFPADIFDLERHRADPITLDQVKDRVFEFHDKPFPRFFQLDPVRVYWFHMPIDHTLVLKTIERRWDLPALTARDAAAPDLGGVLTLTKPRTDDPVAGVVAPTSTGENPASGEVSHRQQLHAQMIADLPVFDEHLVGAPVLVEQTTPAHYANYIAARSNTWQAARDAGQAPAG